MNCKRITALLTAASLLLCGCQSVPKTDPAQVAQPETAKTDADENTVPLAEDALTASVKAQVLPAPGSVWGFYNASPVSDGISLPGNDNHLFHYSAETSEWTETALTPMAPYNGYYDAGGVLDIREDGIGRLTVTENHSGIDPDTLDEEDYDGWETYWSDYVSEYWLCTYTPDGTLTGKVQVTGLEAYAGVEDGQVVPVSLLCEEEGTYLTLSDGGILRIEADGQVTQTQAPPEEENEIREDGRIRTFLRDRDGRPLVFDEREYSTPTDVSIVQNRTITEFDVKTGRTGAVLYTGEEPWSGQSRLAAPGGYGDYRLFVDRGNTLLGIREDGTAETVIDWDASDLAPMQTAPLPDGSFLAYELNDGGNGTWYRLTRLHKSETGDKRELTLAVMNGPYQVKEFVQSFNRAHSDIRITTRAYTDSENRTALEQLKMDLVSDDAPDLVLLYDGHEQFLKLGSKGAFCDLNEDLARDAQLSRDALVPNVLTALQHPDGALYALPSGFVVETIAVKSKFTDKESWTVDDMLALYEGADDIFYYWSTKEDALLMFLTGVDFTDELAGTCRFDSPEFVKILEFCDRYPAESTTPEKNYEDPEQTEKWQNWYYENFMKYQRDQDYLYPFAISAPGGFALPQWSYVKAELGGDMTLTGYPSDNGQGGRITTVASHYTECGELGIVSTTSDRDTAWEVVKAYVEDAKEYNERPAFSILDAAFEEQMDGMMYVWDDDKPSDVPYVEDNGNEIHPLTQEERDALERYIRGCDTFMMLDETVKTIVLEEAGMYFAGDRTAQETARKIQSRAELYLSEQS